MINFVMNSSVIRKKFLDFFEKNGHKIVPSASLLPKDDPSVLLTTAGMQQFKPYYIGKKDPLKDFGEKNTASVQKSFRTSDIDEVGDESHLTFFEMLGNFSFGGYFKEEAIKLAWRFVTEELKISTERIYVSVFAGDSEVPEDKESIAIWKNLGIPENKIKKAGRKDNFWGPTGNEGPCGPTSEIYVDDIEIWNLVFNEYYCDSNKNLKKLEQNGVDTGMGLERLMMVINSSPTIFETDLFGPIIQSIPHTNNPDESRIVRIIADHIRAAVFLIADGALPSNVAQGYILRRILRRAIRFGKILNLPKHFLIPLAQKVIETYKDFYPEVLSKKEDILTVIEKEDEKFSQTLDLGLREFEKLLKEKKEKLIHSEQNRTISGEEAFRLYESFGFPLELTKELAGERGFNVDEKNFEESLRKHQEMSRAGAEKKFGGHGINEKSEIRNPKSETEIQKITRLHTATHLLNQALHDVLDKEGAEIMQKGSDINPKRARFDFTFPRKITAEELKEIEDIVNEKIREDLQVTFVTMSKEKALQIGARGVFLEKYPNEVKVYSIGSYSKEMCGGPHVSRTGQIGGFRILKEESSSAGVRRIRIQVDPVEAL